MCVQKNHVLATFRTGHVGIGGVEVTGKAARSIERSIPNEPADIWNGPAFRPNEVDAGRLEERHREVAGEVHPVGRIPDIYRKSLDQIFTVVPVVERPRAKEERQGRVDRWLRLTFPRDPNPTASESNRILARRRK